MIEKNEMIFGTRAVMEALEAGKDVDRVLLKKDLQADLSKELLEMLKYYDVPVQRVPQERLDRITRKNHQGVVAFISAVAYMRLEDILPTLYEEGKVPFFVVLDGVTDVRNFGAIARTCECAGVDAIVIPQRGSVSVNADAIKTSAGALLHIPVCRESSLHEALRYLKHSGVQLVAATEKSETTYTLADYTQPIAIIMGAEDTGIAPENIRLCENVVSLPMYGEIGSLNVGVATGIMLYEVIRQRTIQ